MEVFIEDQLVYTLYAFVCGMIASMLYDVFRIARVLTGTGCKASTYRSLEKVKLPFIGNLCSTKNNKINAFTEILNITALFFCDLLYFIILSIAAVVFLYNANYGIPRWYYAAAAIVGFVLYFLTVGKLTMQLSGLIAFVIKTIFAYIYYFTVRPVILLIKLLKKFIRFLALSIKRIINKKRDKKYTVRFLSRLEKEISEILP